MSESQEKLLLQGARVIDPAQGIDEVRSVLIENGVILALDAPSAFAGLSDTQIISLEGKLLTPGLVDIHVHLREPGQEWKETVATGVKAAVAGGFTRVCCMPNTRPINDCSSVTENILEKARAANLAKVLPIGAITMGSKGESLAPYIELKNAGCVAFSDDGWPVSDAGVMRKALEYNLMLGTVLTVHEEDLSLSGGFAMNESARSVRMGLKGMPDAAENVMIARDIELARLTGGRVHFCHVSTARGVELIRRAKEDGIPVTAEVLPHHFLLDESAVEGYDTQAKMSMPLRLPEDVAAMCEGLRDGVIDCISSDHAPHESDSKTIEFDKASFGILGLQTTVPLTLQKVRDGAWSLQRAIEALTIDATRCLNLEPATLTKGRAADITVIDTERKFVLEKKHIQSKSVNTPFFGTELQGHAERTFVNGKQVYSIEELFENEEGGQ